MPYLYHYTLLVSPTEVELIQLDPSVLCLVAQLYLTLCDPGL